MSGWLGSDPFLKLKHDDCNTSASEGVAWIVLFKGFLISPLLLNSACMGILGGGAGG